VKTKLPRRSEFFELVTYPIAAIAAGILLVDIHEAGPALMCKAIGGNIYDTHHVCGFRHWLHGILPFTRNPGTDCTITTVASVWAAGPLTSIGVWFASAYIVTMFVKRGSLTHGVFWFFWSLVFLWELASDTIQAYAPPSTKLDTTQVVHLLGINPNFVGLPLAAIFLITLPIAWRIQRRLWA
jgi:hypothetical protein